MNTRIERDLKREGDRVLKAAGYSPSEAVRGLYRFVCVHAKEPEALKPVLDQSKEIAAESSPQLEALHHSWTLASDGMRELGLSAEEPLFEDGWDYNELRDAYLMERLTEKDARAV